MIRLEHVNLVVGELEPTLNFLKAAFPDWRVRGHGADEWYGRPRRWVHFGTDDTYITLNDGAVGENRDLAGHTPGLAHIGFDIIDGGGLIARMKAAGYEPSKIVEDGFYRRRIYYIEPSGFEFEFVEYTSDLARERNEYTAPAPFTAEAVPAAA